MPPIHRVTFQRPQAASDGAGGVLNGYATAFQCRASYRHLRGGETVLAARLEGTHTQVIRVNSAGKTRAVSTDWRIVDDRTGDVFNIRDITPTEDLLELDFLCQKGVAT